MTNDQLAEIEVRANAATPGPWHLNSADGCYTVCTGPEDDTDGPHECIASIFDTEDGSDFKNAVFCAHSRADVPALIAEVRRLRTEAARTVLDGLSVQALVAENEALKTRNAELSIALDSFQSELFRTQDEAAKNRRGFVWEPFKDEGEWHYRLRFNDEFEFRLTYYNEEPLLELYSADDEFLRSWDACYWFPEERFDKSEQLIRELGFARDGDTFERSKVTP